MRKIDPRQLQGLCGGAVGWVCVGWLCPRAAEVGTSGEITQAESTRGSGDAATSPTKREDVCLFSIRGLLEA